LLLLLLLLLLFVVVVVVVVYYGGKTAQDGGKGGWDSDRAWSGELAVRGSGKRVYSGPTPTQPPEMGAGARQGRNARKWGETAEPA
jgi:hypothetical protein